jgi:hypothetical protein
MTGIKDDYEVHNESENAHSVLFAVVPEETHRRSIRFIVGGVIIGALVALPFVWLASGSLSLANRLMLYEFCGIIAGAVAGALIGGGEMVEGRHDPELSDHQWRQQASPR